MGDHNLKTLTSVKNLGVLLYYQGKFEEAQVLSRRVIKRGSVLGVDHPNTLTSVNNLKWLLFAAMKAGQRRGAVPTLPKHPSTN